MLVLCCGIEQLGRWNILELINQFLIKNPWHFNLIIKDFSENYRRSESSGNVLMTRQKNMFLIPHTSYTTTTCWVMETTLMIRVTSSHSISSTPSHTLNEVIVRFVKIWSKKFACNSFFMNFFFAKFLCTQNIFFKYIEKPLLLSLDSSKNIFTTTARVITSCSTRWWKSLQHFRESHFFRMS